MLRRNWWEENRWEGINQWRRERRKPEEKKEREADNKIIWWERKEKKGGRRKVEKSFDRLVENRGEPPSDESIWSILIDSISYENSLHNKIIRIFPLFRSFLCYPSHFFCYSIIYCRSFIFLFFLSFLPVLSFSFLSFPSYSALKFLSIFFTWPSFTYGFPELSSRFLTLSVSLSQGKHGCSIVQPTPCPP